MQYADIKHLIDLYTQKYHDLRKTNPDAATKFHNSTLPKLWERQNEIHARSSEEAMKIHNAFVDQLPIRLPQTEESPAVIIEVGERPGEDNQGGK